MQKFEGIIIPEHPKFEQFDYCNGTQKYGDCEDLECKNCIFNIAYKDQFNKWLKT